MLFETGTYTGNGSSQTINLNEIAGTPDFVMISKDAGNAWAGWKTSSMAGNLTLRFASATTYTDAITAFGAGSFDLGGSFVVNANSAVYHYVAFYDDGAGDFTVGIYTGSSGTDDREISGLGFQPECVMVFKHGANVNRIHSDSMGASTDSSPGIDNVAAAADYIQDLTVPANDGFEVGTQLNTDAVLFSWVAWKPVANFIDSIRWTGDGNDDTNKTIVANGGTAEFALVKDGGGFQGVWRAEENGRGHSGDDATNVRGISVANVLQAFSANTIQVGNDSRSNASGRTYDLFWVITNPAAPAGGTTNPFSMGAVNLLQGKLG